MASIKKGDFVELDYTGRLTEEGIIFDTTEPGVAKENNLQNPPESYQPIVICVGQKQVVKGLDEQLDGKELNKQHTFNLTAEEAFGKKNGKLVQLIPTSKFKKQNIQPMPGLQVNIDNHLGLIKTVSGGRTLVDFNHPLAGKNVTYTVTPKRVVTDTKEKVASFIKAQLNQPTEVTIEKDTANVKIEAFKQLPKEALDQFSQELAKNLTLVVPEVKKLTIN